jgi:uncharacterized ferredoxin-like protein
MLAARLCIAKRLFSAGVEASKSGLIDAGLVVDSIA